MGDLLQLTVDSFKNFVSGLNTNRDKQNSGTYQLSTMTDVQWSDLYRVSWIGRKLIDIPAEDATRKWREWQAEANQIELIEAEEKRLQLPQKVKLALQQARLFGGAGIYYSIKGQAPETPFEASTVRQGALQFVTVLSKNILTPGEIEMDPMAERYGLPKWYEVSSQSQGVVRIHPSRLAIFLGNPLLTAEEAAGQQLGWGDSVLMSSHGAIRNADSTATNIASLVYEAKVDVLKIPGLANIMSNPKHRALLTDRVALSALLKSNNGMLVIDAEESYEQKNFTFSGLTDINRDTLVAVCGAADIPATRFLGQSPGGLNASGTGELKNYYDSISSMQTLVMSPALFSMDEAIIQSALGDRPKDVWYTWSSLWQMSDTEKSTIGMNTATTIKTLAETMLYPESELGEAGANMLVERGVFPSFDISASMIEEMVEEQRAQETAALAQAAKIKQPTQPGEKA